MRIRDVAYTALTPLWGESWVKTPPVIDHGVTSELLSSKPGLPSNWVSTQAGAAVVVVDSAWAVVVDSANVVVVTTSEAIDDALSVGSVSVVLAVDSTKMVVDSANVVVVVTASEAIVVSDAIDDALSVSSASVVLAVDSVKTVVVASARVVIAVEPEEVVKGRHGPASTPERNRATATAVRLEKRTILAKWKNKAQTSGQNCR